jgi:hypothetical protein
LNTFSFIVEKISAVDLNASSLDVTWFAIFCA